MITDAAPATLTLGPPTTAPDVRPLYDGYLYRLGQSAAALLLVAASPELVLSAAGHAAGWIAAADPAMTVASAGIRFESSRPAAGVAARYDVLTGGLDPLPSQHGTTNVDLNGPAREVLSGVHGTDPLRVRIGEGLTITTPRP